MPAVAILPDLVVGFVLVILAFAAIVLFRPLVVGLLSQLPVVGGWVAARVNGLLISVLGAAVAAIDAGVLVVRDFITAVFNDTWGHRVATGQAIESAFNAAWRIQYRLIPFVWTQLGAHIDFVWRSLGAHVDDVWRASTDYTTRVWKAVTDYTTAVWVATTDYTTAVWKASTDYTTAVWRAMGDYVNGIWAQLGAHIDAVWVQVTAYARDLVGAEAGRAIEAERQLQADIAGAAGAAVGLAERLWADERARAIAAEAGVAAAGAAAVAGVSAAVRAIEDSPCQRFCSPLGDLGQLLDQLAGDAVVAAILALAAAAARDGQLVGDQVAGDVAPIAGAVLSDVRQLVTL